MASVAQAPSYQQLYRSCMKEAAAQGRTLMKRLVVRARTSLTQRATQTPEVQERNLLTESARILMKHDIALCEAYPQALLAEFAQAIAGDTRKAGALSFDALELMGDDQVREGVELVRTQQLVLHAVEAELAELNTLVCAVQGLKSVQIERNPLRPEVYVRSLRTVTLESPVPPAVRARWMQHLGEAMGPELARVYRELSDMLKANGVSAAGYNITPAPESSALAVRESGGAYASEPAQAATLLNVRELRRLLSGEFDTQERSAGGAVRPADFSMTVPAAYEALQEMKQVDQVMQRLQQRQAAGMIDVASGTSVLREELRRQASGMGQALGLEVVNLMVENIASDPRLLPPVQQTVRELEPALLRLALTDPRFFSDKRHPARQLIEQMTQRSLAWHSVDAPGFSAFLDPLQQAVDALLATRIDGAEPFDFALKSLEEAWGDQQKRDRRYREKAVRALLQAEQRNLLAGRIARELRNRDDVMLAPRPVVQFVCGPWSQVMAQARLTDQGGTADPGGYGDVVGDLVLSVQPRLGPGNATRLARMVPPLLANLRRGLASIDYPPAQTQRFLDQLAGLHAQCLKPPEPVRPVPLSTTMTREQLEAEFGDGAEDNESWLAPSEAQHSGFMETDQPGTARPLFQPTQPGFGPTRPPEDAADNGASGLAPALPGLQAGAWVDLFVDGGWARYQLTWSSPHGTLFMFTANAGKTHSMTRRLLDKMLAAGTLRMVSGQAVVDGALDAVAHTAFRNSLNSKL
ncbi:MAG: DUF1631 family protein [Comamonadaceae bacterium]|nr:MAG: DUF1631 family protein [Comamonadaceae bacterium]